MLSVIIPAASHGSKSLSVVTERHTLIEHQIYKIQNVYPNAEIITVIGHESDKVLKKIPSNIKIIENELYAETGSLRNVAIGLRVASHNNVLIVGGNTIFNENSISIFNRNKSFILVHKDTNNLEVGVNVNNGKATSLAFGVSPKWSKILYLAPRELEKFKRMAFDRGKRKWYIYEACNSVIDDGGIFYTKLNKDIAREFDDECTF